MQRIGIARALYNQPEILILDEATASLDYTTEINVMEAIKNIKKDKTLIIVAHRLTTIDDCDYIYKIEKGELNLTFLLIFIEMSIAPSCFLANLLGETLVQQKAGLPYPG